MNTNEEYKALKGQMSIFDYVDESANTAKHFDMEPPTVVVQKHPKKVSADFGEHIGGARKELWRSRGLDIGDLFAMNNAEREKLVKKDNVWKKPDYDAMLSDGWDPVVVYAKKKVRDALSQTIVYRSYETDEAKEKKQEGYISFCHELMALTERFKDRESVISEGHDFLYLDGYIEKKGYSLHATEKSHGFLDNKLFKTINISEYTLKAYEREMEKKQFGVKKEDKVPAGYSIRYNDGNGYYSRLSSAPGTYFVCKGYRIVMDNLPTREKALEIAKQAASANQKARKKAFTPPQLSHIRREGLPDVRNGRDVQGEDFLKDFSIRGGEFGEWMSEKDAQASLNMAYEALYDFASALGITADRVSFGGKLAIAFGARGHGKALAHYEPAREVINLTKMRGAGSLGHELFHALDDIIGKKLGLGGMMTENLRKPSCPESVRKVVETMQYRKVTQEEANEAKKIGDESADKRIRQLIEYHVASSIKDEAGRQKVWDLFKDIKASFNCIEPSIQEAYNAVEKLSNLKKELTGKIIRKDARDDLRGGFLYYQALLFADCTSKKVKTTYYSNSKAMDEITSKDSHGYWSSTCEMFARAGACFLTDALKDLGARSDYLSGHSESCVGVKYDTDGNSTYIKAMPTGEDRKAINEAIREMLNDLIQNNLL